MPDKTWFYQTCSKAGLLPRSLMYQAHPHLRCIQVFQKKPERDFELPDYKSHPAVFPELS